MNANELVAGGSDVKVRLLLVDEERVGHPDVLDELRADAQRLDVLPLLEREPRVRPELPEVKVQREVLAPDTHTHASAFIRAVDSGVSRCRDTRERAWNERGRAIIPNFPSAPRSSRNYNGRRSAGTTRRHTYVCGLTSSRDDGFVKNNTVPPDTRGRKRTLADIAAG